MSLPRFHQIMQRTSTRHKPCREYPGTWIVYAFVRDVDPYDGEELVSEHKTEADAQQAAFAVYDRGMHDIVSIAWHASDDDPRIDEVWFRPFRTVIRLKKKEGSIMNLKVGDYAWFEDVVVRVSKTWTVNGRPKACALGAHGEVISGSAALLAGPMPYAGAEIPLP